MGAVRAVEVLGLTNTVLDRASIAWAQGMLTLGHSCPTDVRIATTRRNLYH